MKYINRYILLFFSVFLIYSCEKAEVDITPMGSLMIVNAIPGGTTAKLNNYIPTVSNNAGAYFSLLAGSKTIYVWPQGDSLHPYYNSTKEIGSGEVYSLYLVGSTAAPEGVLVKETIPYRKDSTAGIRFINLANNNGALNISLATTPTVNEVTGLAYKSYTEFKTYPALYNSAPTFQIKDATGTVLTTFAFAASTMPRFSNVTLVIRQNGTGVAVFRVNNDR